MVDEHFAGEPGGTARTTRHPRLGWIAGWTVQDAGECNHMDEACLVLDRR
jgi:hypothetical protein